MIAMKIAASKFTHMLGILVLSLILITTTGCTSCHSESPEEQASESTAPKSNAADTASNEGSQSDDLRDLIDKGVSKANELSKEAETAVSDASNSEPVHVRIGEWVNATDNLDVRVDSIEQGPYDYADSTPTMKVTVSMRNLTDRTLTVKASNWNADNTDGQRVDHKLWVKNGNGSIADRSFELTRISPDSVFTGTVYFDGNGLVDVIYEPHWLVSTENQYIYFEI